MRIEEIIKKKPEGFSIVIKKDSIMVNPYIMDIKKEIGYIVSITDLRLEGLDADTIFKLYLKMALKINCPNMVIGFWGGFFDLGLILTNKTRAKTIKTIFNQTAAYDIINNKLF